LTDNETPAPDPAKPASNTVDTPDQKALKPTRRAGCGPNITRAVAPPALNDKDSRAKWGLPRDEDSLGYYMLELNLTYGTGVIDAGKQFLQIYAGVVGADQMAAHPPVPIAKSYFRCFMSVKQWRALIKKDQENPSPTGRTIYRIWPDFPVNPLIDHSTATVKADAAVRSYSASGDGICWAVIDSGISAKHIHFGSPSNPLFQTLTHPSVVDLHRDFTTPAAPTKDTALSALIDNYGHGTHVAGIIAGGLAGVSHDAVRIYENVFSSGDDGGGEQPQQTMQQRQIPQMELMRGVAPQCKLISLKVLNDDGEGRTSDIMRALTYIREELNGDPKLQRVHGVNLSIGYEFDAEMFACGQSPLCQEVDRLVRSGVVVVVAAGNTGYGALPAKQRQTSAVLSNTINDPGNSALAITVGATHRDSPHIYGVSYFSSKGPTGDGRIKPDLVAPGERITSCAAGKYLTSNDGDIPDDLPAYIDDSGTSMAAPHVSGAIAAFLSIRREFILQPFEIKRIFMESATTLHRERYFEGSGLVDLMRAIQSV
jgi:subtilisin family serine protease